VERRKPLKANSELKKTALKATSSLKAKKGLSATKSLKPRSKKMKDIYKQRSVFVAEFLSKHPQCQAYWDDNCFGRSVDVHEILPRSAGGKIVSDDLSNFMAVCRYCHTQITVNPEEAHRRGFRKWSWENP